MKLGDYTTRQKRRAPRLAGKCDCNVEISEQAYTIAKLEKQIENLKH